MKSVGVIKKPVYLPHTCQIIRWMHNLLIAHYHRLAFRLKTQRKLIKYRHRDALLWQMVTVSRCYLFSSKSAHYSHCLPTKYQYFTCQFFLGIHCSFLSDPFHQCQNDPSFTTNFILWLMNIDLLLDDFPPLSYPYIGVVSFYTLQFQTQILKSF